MTAAARDPGLGLAGEKLLIVGAASGIGLETARLAAAAGASLVLADREPITFPGTSGDAPVELVVLDITDRAEVEQALAEAAPFDALVVTAAYCPFDDWMAEDWDAAFDEVMSVNVHGIVNLCRSALDILPEGSGRIVLLGSVAGRMGGVAASPHYVASKGAAHALVRWMAQAGAPRGIRVNGVAPGPTNTPMIAKPEIDTARIPLGRVARPEEIAWPVLFLASPRASYLTGAIIDVNGGLHMS